ncbi:hypothetical protein PT974_05734 [Cladobotryum mycophilum]|uniref:2EXR domain-containing protein n=1 Tax=Cladobotryum mycophilum TaxID=491253 RepID=A0ABR0SKX4_9HYPO
MAQTAQTFHLFPHLPTEIRLAIWFICLPRRFLEVDHPHPDGLERGEPNAWDGQRCGTRSTSAANASMPHITAVCRESRQVVLENGQLKYNRISLDIRDCCMTSTGQVHCQSFSLNSGLLGRFGDEPIQLVDARDINTIRTYYRFWVATVTEMPRPIPRPHAFGSMLESEQEYLARIETWHATSTFLLLVAVWEEARVDGFPGVEYPEGIWSPPVAADEMPLVRTHAANENHP